jgi:hypothetical protein
MNNLRGITRVSVNLFLVQALNKSNSFIKLRVPIRVPVRVPVRERFIYKYYKLLQKLEKRYAPALDNYGQSCFVRSD